MIGYLVILSIITVSSTYQREVDLLNPCNSEQRYTVENGDELYLRGTQHNLSPSCRATMMAGNGCSKLCFEMQILELKDCFISFKAASGFVNSKFDYIANCRNGTVGDVWCSKEDTATVEMSSTGWAGDGGVVKEHSYTYNVKVKVTAKCVNPINTNTKHLEYNISVIQDESEPEPKSEPKWTLPQGAFIGAIIGACIASIVGTSLLFLLVYFVCVKRKQESQNMIQYQNPRYAPVPDDGLVVRPS